MCACLSVREHISRSTRAIFTNFSVHVAYDRSSVLPWWGDALPRGMGNFFVAIDNALYWPYNGMHFATNDRFGLNLLIYLKSDRI